MKLILTLTLVWAFSSTAGAIRCHRCVDVNDLDCRFDRVEECRANEICLNAFITEADGTERIYRDCASPDVCPSVGPLNISSNLGGIIAVANATCCDTDECNVATLGYPALPEVNGIQCPGCDSDIEDCDEVVACRGEEDSCFQSFLLKDREVIVVGGCATENVCTIADDIGNLPFMEEVGTILNTTCYPFTTTTTAPPPTTTTEPPTVASTTVYTVAPDFFPKAKALVEALQYYSAQINLESLKLKETVLFQLHLKLLDAQSNLLQQQGGLPFDHHEQLPLHYQQCLLVNNHQSLLQQIHYSLCGELHLRELFSKQQQVIHQLQELLQSHHLHLLPHYDSHLDQHCDHE
ncbi:unnamed protein product [Ophioblennius macclurei]